MTTTVSAETHPYDAILLLSFGGPEGMDEILPFLRNVLRGRDVPESRMIEVSHHYELFDGVSPINQQNRDLIAALRPELDQAGITLPIYWGNRNWRPMLADTLRQMRSDGIKRAAVFVTSAFSSYSGCRQYREDIERAIAEVGEPVPQLDVLRRFYNHPGFITANSDHLRAALEQIPAERRAAAHIAFTAHSVPTAMAAASPYVEQLEEACGLVASPVSSNPWRLVYQSRSGPPTQPWLEPDILDHIREVHAAGVTDLVVLPIGFVSDHLEVKYDLDVEAAALAAELGMTLVRAESAGTHPAFVSLVRELIQERTDGAERRYLGDNGPRPDACPPGCCVFNRTRPAPAGGEK